MVRPREKNEGQWWRSPAQLKTIQEIITLVVFALFSIFYLGESLRWNHAAAFACLVLAGYFAFAK